MTPLLEYVNLYGPQFGFDLLIDQADAPFNFFYTANISMPRDVPGEAPFHPAFPTAGWEDTELGYRLTRRGLRIVYERSASARHWHPTDLPGFYRRQRRMGAAIKPLLRLHPQLEARLVPPTPAALRWAPRLLGPCLEAALPLLDVLDRRQVALPKHFYERLLNCAFHRGFAADQGRRTTTMS